MREGEPKIEILEPLRLCGVLPCLSESGPEAQRAYVEALVVQGFPAVEAACAGEIRIGAEWEAVFHLPGIVAGARVRNTAQAAEALAAGACWVTLPATEAGKLSPQAPAFLKARNAAEARAFAREKSAGTEDGPVFCCEAERAEEILRACPGARLLPAGGLDAARNRELLARPRVAAVRLECQVESGQAQARAAALKRAWGDALGFSLAHIGINGADAQTAAEIAKAFSRLLGASYRPGSASDYAGTLVEAMKGDGRGTHGHIGIAVDNLARGLFYAERAGFAFDPSSRKNDDHGRAILYYLEGEIGGFAVHIL